MAPTAAAVRTAFSAVFDDSNVKAITERVYSYDLESLILRNLGDNYTALSKYNGEINFIQWVTKRVEIYQVNDISYEYVINLSYFREVGGVNTAAAAHTAACDIWPTVLQAIRDTVGHTFSDTVGGYLPQEAEPAVEAAELDGAQVWRTDFQITALA